VRFISIAACTLLAAGCAIRPLPEQVTGVTTFHIVKQIRCETREAVFNNFVKTIADNADVFGEKARTTAEAFRGHPELMDQFRPGLFSGDARDFVNYFWNAGIAYNFSLDMTEINNLDANLDFIQPLAVSTRTLALGGGLDRQRENIRTFTITDDFKGLLNLKPKSYCDGYVVETENHVYPIVGKIGIEPFIYEFVRIALFTKLKEDKDSGAPTMVDTLKFQTVLSGSATPKVVFAPIGRAFQVADASLTALAKRTDIHTLTMGLSVLGGPVDQSPAGSKQLYGRLLTSSGGGAKKSAANAVDQELTRQALSKTVIVNQ
jgi:hypothetical protein